MMTQDTNRPPADHSSVTPTPSAAGSSVDAVSDLVRLLKLLADETRLRILVHLSEHRELNVRTLCQMLTQSQPAVSHHLALLRVDRLIECRRDGKHNFYRVLPERFGELLQMLKRVLPGNEDGIRLGDRLLSLRPTKPADE